MEEKTGGKLRLIATVVGVSITLLANFGYIIAEREEFKADLRDAKKDIAELQAYVVEDVKQHHRDELETTRVRAKYIDLIEELKLRVVELEKKQRDIEEKIR